MYLSENLACELLYIFSKKKIANRDKRLLKDCHLTHKCSLRGIPKDDIGEKIGVAENKLWGGGYNFFKGLG